MKYPFLKIGVSACLLGQEVRFDGGHKKEAFVYQVLRNYFELIGVCPEVEAGLPTPRESMTLRKSQGKIRLLGNKTEKDYTSLLSHFSQQKMQVLEDAGLSGYVLKKNSPSCGMERVRISSSNQVSYTGVGVFANHLKKRFPLLPMEEEGRLQNPVLRENWIERVFAYARIQELSKKPFLAKAYLQFHTAHKFLILAHSPTYYQRLGNTISNLKCFDPQTYQTLFMDALSILATRKNHTNVLEHMAGFLKDQLETEEKNDMHLIIQDFRLGRLPLSAPLTLLNHLVKKHRHEYLAGQIYLAPYPKELALRNFIPS